MRLVSNQIAELKYQFLLGTPHFGIFSTHFKKFKTVEFGKICKTPKCKTWTFLTKYQSIMN